LIVSIYARLGLIVSIYAIFTLTSAGQIEQMGSAVRRPFN
jgi:hypothetical protein